MDPQSPASAAEALDGPILGVSSELNHPQIVASTRYHRPTADGVPSLGNAAQKRAIQMMDQDFQHAIFLREPKPEPDTDDLQCTAPASSCQNAQSGRVASHPLNASTSDTLPVHTPSKISGFVHHRNLLLLKLLCRGGFHISYIVGHKTPVFVILTYCVARSVRLCFCQSV